MGVGQQVRDGQSVGAAGQAGSAALAGLGIYLFPPGPGPADEVVALRGEGLHAMAQRHLPQPQQSRDRHLLGAGKTGTALAAPFFAQPFPPSHLELLDGLPLLVAQGPCGIAQLLGPVEIGWARGPKRQGADALAQQKAVGELQGCEGGAVRHQEGGRILQPAPFVRR